MTARERLAQVLGTARGGGEPWVRLDCPPQELELDVAGVGPIALPVTAAKARALRAAGRPARFGRGEQTLTDSRVRDTWEIPAESVRATWGPALESTLDAVRAGLGLPRSCTLTAQLHALLVYEPGQFFVKHQDSEKDDAMVATLVVGLPSRHTGGDLVIEHAGSTTTCPGSQDALSLAAFYADCRHEVRPVKTGYRIALTYNLLVEYQDTPTSGPARGAAAVADPVPVDLADLIDCLQEHFSTRVRREYSTKPAVPPSRLVYLLDHEYSARALGWERVKGADARRAELLRAAAERADCDTALALIEIQQTWSAEGPEDEYWDDEYEEFDDEEEDEGEDEDEDDEGRPAVGRGEEPAADDRFDDYRLDELIDSTATLVRWVDSAGKASAIALDIEDFELCANTATNVLRPYSQEYEGYMGNYGNTMDRWYRRAALVLWPRRHDFRNRAEADPARALGELCALAAAGETDRARSCAASLGPIWADVVRSKRGPELLDLALQAARALDDPAAAVLLTDPFGVEDLRADHGAALARLADRYGADWTGALLRTWFGRATRVGESEYDHTHGPRSSDGWLDALPELCAGLHAAGEAGRATGREAARLAWAGYAPELTKASALAPSRRGHWAQAAGERLCRLLAAAVYSGADDVRGLVLDRLRGLDEPATDCLAPTLRAAGRLPQQVRDDEAFQAVAGGCAAALRARLDRTPRAADDWSIRLTDGCECELCRELGDFLRSRTRLVHEWPLAEPGRRHVHLRIENAELAVRHETRRTGRPYTLILTKTEDLFRREQAVRTRDAADLAYISADWPTAVR